MAMAHEVGGIFGVAGMAGAYIGGILAGFVPEHILLCLFAIMTLATGCHLLYNIFILPQG